MTQVGSALPSVPRSPPKPGERTEFSGINDFLHYIIERDEVERREKRKQQQSNIEKPPWWLICDFDQPNIRSCCALILSSTKMLVKLCLQMASEIPASLNKIGKKKKKFLAKRYPSLLVNIIMYQHLSITGWSIAILQKLRTCWRGEIHRQK